MQRHPSMIGATLALGALTCLAIGACAVHTHAESNAGDRLHKADTSASWNAKAAAAYLDQREAYWETWPLAARDHGTFCISCHTVVPYALARPALRGPLSEKAPSEDERKLLENVTERVRFWNEVKPFYNDEKSGPHKTPEARGTEAVLNALILATYDARTGDTSEDADASRAFANMWALQHTTGDDAGSWDWLDFHNEPFEAPSSHYYGSALAAVAVGIAPHGYGANPEIQENVKLLCGYLQRGLEAQTPINQAVVLWASSRLPGLLTAEQQRSIVHELSSQQRGDGGWALASLVGPWKRRDDTPLEVTSDGYATGLVTLALEQSGVSSDDPRVKRALAWLSRNQDRSTGYWLSYSLNKQRDPSNQAWPFMNDAATAYAVLALTQNNSR
jgi:squalene-hopene/tetraprenyl-beta-curcumene cyclase